jgi:hypothetical protein
MKLKPAALWYRRLNAEFKTASLAASISKGENRRPGARHGVGLCPHDLAETPMRMSDCTRQSDKNVSRDTFWFYRGTFQVVCAHMTWKRRRPMRKRFSISRQPASRAAAPNRIYSSSQRARHDTSCGC